MCQQWVGLPPAPGRPERGGAACVRRSPPVGRSAFVSRPPPGPCRTWHRHHSLSRCRLWPRKPPSLWAAAASASPGWTALLWWWRRAAGWRTGPGAPCRSRPNCSNRSSHSAACARRATSHSAGLGRTTTKQERWVARQQLPETHLTTQAQSGSSYFPLSVIRSAKDSRDRERIT